MQTQQGKTVKRKETKTLLHLCFKDKCVDTNGTLQYDTVGYMLRWNKFDIEQAIIVIGKSDKVVLNFRTVTERQYYVGQKGLAGMSCGLYDRLKKKFASA